jgi:hypothetical protein
MNKTYFSMRNSQSPSIYSIYHNALPFYLDRADICFSDETDEQFAIQFIQNLLSSKLTVQLNASNLAADKLRHLYFESRNYEKTYGAKTFGFGYPIVIDTYNSDLLVAPLFTWLLTIEPAQTRVDSWVIKFTDQHHLLPNYRIISYLDEKYGLDFKDRMEALSFGKQMSKQALSSLCHDLAARLQFEELGSENEIISSPGIDEIGNFTEKGALHWSGILSLFPPQNKRSQPVDLKPEEVISVQGEANVKDTFIFPYLPADPEQATALETIFRNKIAVVEGEDALGKTQTLVDLLINALSNGQKCLVVSERAPALKYTQNMLARTGLNQFHFLLDDALNDKQPMLELLRVAATGGDRHIPFSEEEFQQKKNKYLREKAKADAAYRAVKKTVFGDKNWTETVGLFLASNRIEGKELLASQLNGQDFEYAIEEYDRLKQGILNCQPLFFKIKTLSHPLSNLHHQVFEKYSSNEGLQFVRLQLKTFIEKTGDLQHRYINKIDAYAARLKAHYQQHFDELNNILGALKDKILGYGDSLGSDFSQAGSRAFSLSFLFSSKKKQVKKAQSEVSQLYKTLLKEYTSRQYFDFEFEPCKEGMNIPKTTANIRHFETALSQWKNQLDNLVQEEVMRLNSKTAHPSLDVKEQITELEYSLDVLLEELNDAKLYQKPLENKTLTIPQRQKYLESIIEQLEMTQLNLRDFDIFHQWQSSWLNLGGLGQKVVRALVKVKPQDWMAAFESWYFNHLLAKYQSADLPAEESLVENCYNAWHQLKPLILNQIINLWQNKQQVELKNLKRQNKQHYQLIFEKSGHKASANLPLDKIFETGFDAVSAYLPVLFVTPNVAMNVLPPTKGYFDFVIFDESNKFSVESATAIAPLGKCAVVFGSNDSYGNETSLIQYALENEVPSVKVTNQYQAPIQFAAGVGEEHEHHYNAVEYRLDNVEGRFHELEGTNDVEAQHIIRLLNQIKQTPQRVYPTVGIVTLTVEQRDLISNYLLKLKQQNSLASEKIHQLERNGMGVFYIDELFGQQFDIIILSCTFGSVNLKGVMTKKMIFLNTQEGVSQLKMLINKPVQSLYLVHSVPEEHLEKFQGKKWEEGTWLLSHLISLAEAKNSGNNSQVKSSIEALGMRMKSKPPKSVFSQEVKNALRPYIDDQRLSKNAFLDDIQLPLSVKPIYEGESPVVIHPDGFFADTAYTSCLWEQEQRTRIKHAGMQYQLVWSTNWLKNPVQEARWLASRIIKHDSQFKPAKDNHSGVGEEKLKESED